MHLHLLFLCNKSIPFKIKKPTFTILFICISMFLFSQNLPLKILAIGDSNGEFDFGWVAQLQKIRSVDKIVNTSISGNTIGFDNLGRKQLNTLKNIDSYSEIKDVFKNITTDGIHLTEEGQIKLAGIIDNE